MRIVDQNQWLQIWLLRSHDLSYWRNAFQSWDASSGNALSLKVLHLKVIARSPLPVALVGRAHKDLHRWSYSPSSVDYDFFFFRILKCWYITRFLSQICIVCLNTISTGVKVDELACPQLVKQYEKNLKKIIT